MAEIHGTIARHGITVQAHRQPSANRGWLSNYMQSMVNRRRGWISEAIRAAGRQRPIRASQLSGGNEFFIHDLHRGYTRYPRRYNSTINLNLDTHLRGAYTAFGVDCSVSTVARAVHSRNNEGQLWIRIRVWNSSGTLIYDWGTISNDRPAGVFGQGTSGRVNYWQPWNRWINLRQPIGRVLVNTRIWTGLESYHSEGDRSNPGSWNPWHAIGSQQQYNYFGLIGINEGWKSHRHFGQDFGDALEIERRLTILNGRQNFQVNRRSRIPYGS